MSIYSVIEESTYTKFLLTTEERALKEDLKVSKSQFNLPEKVFRENDILYLENLV